MTGKRLDPEEFLKRTEEEARISSRGQLKIYLGAAPGVGKTYTMLHDALEKRAHDLDVVVGVVESHGRRDIEMILKKFDVLPRLQVDYRGQTIEEFDLDAALRRQPGLILMDEMAHSNTPGLRHAKRWQDIKELLDRGIDVYTTLNVQHIESLKDDVAQIIQAPISETVPDSMIAMANTIELVDLPPEELLKRLHDGKIYIPKQVALATEHFFRKGNLIALRELALRTTAARVGTDVLLYRQNEGITQIWPTKDKILVCVGPKLDSLKLIRAAKRIATSLQAEWIAIYVDTPRLQSSTELRNSAIQNLRLAEQLGAVTHVLTGFDIVKEILRFSREQNVTQIMIWKHIHTRWGGWFNRHLADEIVRHSGEIDVYMMTGTSNESFQKKPHSQRASLWRTYGQMLLILIMATLFNITVYPFMAASNLVMVYLLAVAMIARLGQVSVSIVASIISVVIYDFLFVPPFYSFVVSDLEYGVTLIVMLLVAYIISYLTIVTKRQAASTRLIQDQTIALYTLSRQLMNTRGVKALVGLGAHYIASVFDCEVIALLPKKNYLLVMDYDQSKPRLDTKERSIAQWVYEMGQAAGLGTDTLSFSKGLYLPLLGSHGPIGVLRIQPKTQQLFTPEQMHLLESCVNQVALAIDVDRLYEKTHVKELKIKTERARINLLTAISNDLHEPLRIIVRAINNLKSIDGDIIRNTQKDIDDEIENLSQLNNNISRIIQLEIHDLKVIKKPANLNEIIHFVVKISHKKLKNRLVKTHVEKSLPSVALNKSMIQEVFINLIDNAVKFTPTKSPITISVHTQTDDLVVSIEDEGPGIALDEMNKLFDKFYRGKEVVTVRGLGLGLAICHKIITVHGGRIWVENGDIQGAVFKFTLPLCKE